MTVNVVFGHKSKVKVRQQSVDRKPLFVESLAPLTTLRQLSPGSLAASLYRAAHLVAAVRTGHNLNQALNLMEKLAPFATSAERGASIDLSYGCLRDFDIDERRLEPLLKKQPDAWLYSFLLVASYRLHQERQADYVLVDQAVEAVAPLVDGKFKGLVNAVLRNLLRSGAGDVTTDSPRLPHWWVHRLQKDHPKAAAEIIAAGNQHPPMALRVNSKRISQSDYLLKLEKAGITASGRGKTGILLDKPCGVDRLPGFFDGLVSVQDLAAQFAAEILAPVKGARVLDACAAPGGKAAHLLECFDGINLLAMDLDPPRLARVNDNLQRLGLTAELLQGDCRQAGTLLAEQSFDYILADVPCSASGVIRRHPDIRFLRRDTDIASFVVTQSEILDSLWPHLKPGGRLLYCTCSVFSAENQHQVASFLRRHGDAQSVGIDGQDQLELLPDNEHDGFFYALIEKQE